MPRSFQRQPQLWVPALSLLSVWVSLALRAHTDGHPSHHSGLVLNVTAPERFSQTLSECSPKSLMSFHTFECPTQNLLLWQPDTFLDKLFLVFDPLWGCKIHEDRDFSISFMIIFQNTKQSLACSRNRGWMNACMHACMLQQVQWCLFQRCSVGISEIMVNKIKWFFQTFFNTEGDISCCYFLLPLWEATFFLTCILLV